MAVLMDIENDNFIVPERTVIKTIQISEFCFINCDISFEISKMMFAFGTDTDYNKYNWRSMDAKNMFL